MEIDRPYFEKARNQNHGRGFGLESTVKEVKRKPERYLEENFGKRHTKKWTSMEHYWSKIERDGRHLLVVCIPNQNEKCDDDDDEMQGRFNYSPK